MHTEQGKNTSSDTERMDQFFRKPKEEKQEQQFFKHPEVNRLFVDEIYNNPSKEFFEYLGKGGSAKDWFGTTDDEMELGYVLAKKLYDTNNYDRALIEFLRLAALDPYDSRFFLGVGHCYLMLEDYEEAYKSYHYAVIYNSKEVRPYFFAAEAALKKNDENSVDYAKRFYQQVIELAKTVPSEQDLAEMVAIAQSKLAFLDKKSTKN